MRSTCTCAQVTSVLDSCVYLPLGEPAKGRIGIPLHVAALPGHQHGALCFVSLNIRGFLKCGLQS